MHSGVEVLGKIQLGAPRRRLAPTTARHAPRCITAPSHPSCTKVVPKGAWRQDTLQSLHTHDVTTDAYLQDAIHVAFYLYNWSQ
ncbi:hypothetical protein Q3G72_017723 [Acer saccharum]|nr:hypothetical protein Q3G72_017723 [Acer saccharum]